MDREFSDTHYVGTANFIVSLMEGLPLICNSNKNYREVINIVCCPEYGESTTFGRVYQESQCLGTMKSEIQGYAYRDIRGIRYMG